MRINPIISGLVIFLLLIGEVHNAMAFDLHQHRLKRADSYLGIHFDFHAGTDCTEVGKNTTPAMIESIINLVHPDYIQIDCKGHPGYSSYPTKVGNPAPGFIGDPLRIWRNVTERNGVALFVHYSGVRDAHAVLNPGWAAINSNGKADKIAISFFSNYSDKLLIPQLRELASDYNIDGVWVDGDCVAVVPDYSAAALKAFHDSTGIQDVPRKSGDQHWFEFLQFNRECYRNYLRHNINELKKTNPNFQYCSNWAFTEYMPEPVSAKVDFLSGDFSSRNSVNAARLSARYLVRQGKPWDLMAWSFVNTPRREQKTVEQLEREAAVVLSQGGGFQVYFTQNRDGSVRLNELPVMAEVAKFCRFRQKLCHHLEPVPQIAIILSTAGTYRKTNRPFVKAGSAVHGVLQALLESQQSVDVVSEHQIIGRMTDYPLIVVPEWEYLEPAFKVELVEYVKSGGNLLLLGPKTIALFQGLLGESIMGGKKSGVTNYVTNNGGLVSLLGEKNPKRFEREAFFDKSQSTKSIISSAQQAASIIQLGKGKIGEINFPIGTSYQDNPNEITRQFLNNIVKELFPDQMVDVMGSHDVDVSVAHNHGKLLVNLINTSGPHSTQSIIESISPVGPLTIRIRQNKKPSKVTLEPSGKSLLFSYHHGRIIINVPQVKIHEIVVVE